MLSTIMLGSINPTLTDIVFEYFLKNPGSSTKQAHIDLKNLHKISMQNVYKIINKLLANKVIVKHNASLFVSQEWILRVQKILPTNVAFEIEEDESARWNFNGLDHLDAFWKHVMLQLSQTYKHQPMFIANPHNIWPFTPQREKSEAEFFKTFTKENRHIYCAVKGSTTKDKDSNKKFETSRIHFSHKEHTISNNHIVVMGDIISTTKLRKQDEENIETLYKNEHLSNQTFKARLISLLEKIPRTTFKIEHNSKKARQLRKKIARDFYVPQEDVQKYNLW